MVDRSQMWDGTAWVSMLGLEPGEAFYLPLSGGVMTGFITLHADPAAPMNAATMQYADAREAAAIAHANSLDHDHATPIAAHTAVVAAHHSRYTDAEAVAAIGTPWDQYLPLSGGTISGLLAVTGGITNGLIITTYNPIPPGGADLAWYQARNARFKDTAGPPDNAEGMDGDVCFMYSW